MGIPDSDSIQPNDYTSPFDSLDTEIVIIDGPWDTTVRPCRPSLRPLLEAEREKIRRWGGECKKTEDNGNKDPQQ